MPAEPRRWVAPSTVALAAAGLGLSAYLTIEHFRDPGTLACPATATVNCARVTTSAQATLLGVPVAVLGVLFFVAMVLVCLPFAWRDLRLTVLRAALAGVGVGFVIYLVYAELFLVGSICLWCTAVHAVTLALFGAVAFATAARGVPRPR